MSVSPPPPRLDTRVDPPHRVSFRRFEHCDELADLTRREGDVQFTQLSAGPFSGSTTRFELGDLRVHHTETVGRTLNRARTQDRLLYYHVLVRTKELVWEGSTVTEQVLIQHCGQDEFVRYGRDLEMVVFCAPRERFLRDAAALAGVRDEPTDLARGVLSKPSASARELANALLGVARRAHEDRSGLREAAYLGTLHRRLEQSLLDVLVDQIGMRRDRLPRPGSRQKILRRAERHLEEAGGRRVSVAELCRAVGVSRRTLEYAFLDLCGVTPQQYLQAKRLRAAQRALRRAEPERGAVKRAALGAGFRDLGRFSVDYRRFFGESPAQTLGRAHG